MPRILVIITIAFVCLVISAQQSPPPNGISAGIPVNYIEDSVGTYTLPEILKCNDGTLVEDPETWYSKRRPEILKLFEDNMFGHSPEPPKKLRYDVFDKGTLSYDGKALRKQVTIYFADNDTLPKIDVLIYLPADSSAPVPLFLNISFFPNFSRVDDPGVKRGMAWDRKEKKFVPAEKTDWGKLDVEFFIDHGIGVATVYYGDIEPDFSGGIQYGVRSLYLEGGQQEFAPDEWGSIGAWSWGISRVMDYFETDKDIDEKKIALFGVSRLGKTVLWAGARDPRFAVVIPSCSGEGGAALSRRNYGETVGHLVAPTRYYYWFCKNYQQYADKIDEMPFDAHMLISLIAPRPLLLQTGNQDWWSDSKGEFLAAVAAGPVYSLLGEQDMGTGQLPAPNNAILNTQGFSIHDGGHGPVPWDFEVIMEYLKRYLPE